MTSHVSATRTQSRYLLCYVRQAEHSLLFPISKCPNLAVYQTTCRNSIGLPLLHVTNDASVK